MRKMILTGLFLFIIAPLAAEEIIIEEAETDVKLEKAEAELDYMKEKVDFYKNFKESPSARNMNTNKNLAKDCEAKK